MKQLNQNTKRRQAGFSLVEVLVALVIMSVGMLGIAGLYVQSMQAGRTSMFSHHAVTLAGDVADRIRSNPTAGTAYEAATGADNSCIAGTVVCTPAQMAAQDILQWQAQAADTLPAGTVEITRDGTGVPAEYEIVVAWTEPGLTPSYTITIPVLNR